MCQLCKPKTDRRRLFGLPLALFGLLLGGLLVGYKCWEMQATVVATSWPGTGSYIALALHALIAAIALVGMISILARWALGVHIFSAGFRFILFAVAFSMIGNWVLWICNMNGIGMENNVHWKPTRKDWSSMIAETVLNLFVLAIGFWAMSGLQSLRRVIAVGGSGWEGKNYREIKTGGKQTMVHSESDSSSDTV
eukprot:Blabericola_migrator_1__11406@NODE_676_length_6914_cov_416_476705_g490_i0_p3_GENE_NODE_676_length_6914_cov_416_476705_g490_i0NODE_676_length_6914_cov_416_476705_g490_i0_p3_ORF_typecomplete_len195_score20_42VKOR/PF07884_14/71_NODE_676_length_6914_cov_416_476705_g490_i031663750